jgi:hypothetical protein
MRILWAALLASTVAFVVAAVAHRSQGIERAVPSAVLWYALAVTALAIAALSLALPRFLTPLALKRERFELSERPATERLFADQARRGRVFAHPAQIWRGSGPALQTGLILGLALAESIALCGFLVLFLGFSWLHGAPFFVVSWVLMLAKYPSESGMRRMIEQTYDADLEFPGPEGLVDPR